MMYNHLQHLSKVNKEKQMTYSTIYPGKTIRIAAGTFVRREGSLAKRKQDAYVTVTRTEPARYGKTRVFWKSHGIAASALV